MKGTRNGKSDSMSRTPSTLESRENQMIALAEEAAEQKLRDGTASQQLIIHYLRLGTTKAKLEKEKMEKEVELMNAKTEVLQSQKNMDEMYVKAINAMRSYQGVEEEVMDEDL